MHFDQRTQTALHEFGLSTEELREVSAAVVEATETDAERIEEFFVDRETVYSDMDLAHSTAEFPEHAVEYVDLFTHADDIRGYLRFDSWGVPVEGGRPIADDVVELSLGATVNDRVRFGPERDAL